MWHTRIFGFQSISNGRFEGGFVLCVSMKKWILLQRFCLALFLLAFGGADAIADPLVLVEDGEVRMPIVVAEKAPPGTVQAAEELADYIERISGRRPEIILGAPEPTPPNAIWVGYQPVLEKLFPEVDFDFSKPEEILLAANSSHLVLAGRDRWNPETVINEDGETEVAGTQQEYGTANAVYTFLQDKLGVRWLWPGESGIDLIERETVNIEPFEYRYHPQIRSRAGMFNYSRPGRRVGYGRSGEWTRLQRVGLDSLSVPSQGHAFATWWERFHETRPEYFALQPDGSRGGGEEAYPGERTVKMCKSNPELWDRWMEEVARELEADPNQVVFDAAANDSWASGYCICENCLAWDHPDGELRRFRWDGTAQSFVAMSDRQVTFANHLARKLKERYPDQDYYVKIFAYGHSRPAPVEAVPDDNVIVVSVANFFTSSQNPDRGSPAGTLHRDQFEAWGKVAPHLFWRPNKTRRMASMPNIPIRQTIEDFRFAADNHCIGVHVDMVWEHWATRGPLYYVMAQMAWDPRQDGEALLEDYYQRGFGKAADSMRGYWELMEQKSIPSQEESWDYPELFDETFFAEAYGYLDQAEEAVRDEPEIYRERIEFVRVGLDYTRWVTEARNLMIRFEESGGEDTAAQDEARRIWVEEIKALATDETNPYTLNWGPMRPGHGHNGRIGGRYPEDLQGNLM